MAGSMKPSLQVRLSQHLALTPQLQQSIRLLQLSTLELHQEVEQMLEQHPFLEAEEDTAPVFEPMAERNTPAERAAERESESAVESPTGSTDDAPGVDSTEFGATEREDWENGTERDDFDGIRETPSAARSSSSDNDDFDPQERNTTGQTLQDFLRAQLPGMRLSPEDAAALHILIESLDDDGYLADPLEDIAAQLAGDGDEEQKQELLERLQ